MHKIKSQLNSAWLPTPAWLYGGISLISEALQVGVKMMSIFLKECWEWTRRQDSLMWKTLVRTVGRNWPEPCALAPCLTSPQYRPEICPRASQRRHAQWQVSAHLLQSASIQHDAQDPAESRRLERDSDYTLRPGEAHWSAFFLRTSSLDPLRRQTQAGPVAGGEPVRPLPAGRGDGRLAPRLGLYHQPPTGFFEVKCPKLPQGVKTLRAAEVKCVFPPTFYPLLPL